MERLFCGLAEGVDGEIGEPQPGGELARSDRRVGELCALAGRRQLRA